MDEYLVALTSWVELNKYLRHATQKDCDKLLDIETSGKRRQTFLKRIHSRLNKVRAETERKALEKLT